MLSRGPGAALGGGAFGPRGRYLLPITHPFSALRWIGPQSGSACTLGAQPHGRGDGLPDDAPIAESHLSELRNMRVLLEEPNQSPGLANFGEHSLLCRHLGE